MQTSVYVRNVIYRKAIFLSLCLYSFKYTLTISILVLYSILMEEANACEMYCTVEWIKIYIEEIYLKILPRFNEGCPKFVVFLNTFLHKTFVTNLTYLLTYSMVQSPSWEANWFAASQEIPRISRNPKVHYRTHKRPLPVSILGQPNPTHIPTSNLLEIRPNIIHPSTPRSPHL